jgi:hypothetical protein
MNKYELVINAEIRQMTGGTYSSGGLTVNERVQLEAADFMQLCQILAEFHKLAEHLKKNPRP